MKIEQLKAELKEKEKGCGYDCEDGEYCSFEDELCQVCQAEITALKKGIECCEQREKEILDKLTPQLFHSIYEEEARKSGWETHIDCINKSFDELPETNQETMINTIRRIKQQLTKSEDKK